VISPSRGPNFANTQCEVVQRRTPLGLCLYPPSKRRLRRRAPQNREYSARWHGNRRVEGPISRIRNARQSAAAPRSAWAPTRQSHITLHGESVRRGNLRSVVVISPSRGSNFASSKQYYADHEKYAMRGRPTPRPARLRSPHTSRTSLSLASVAKGGIFEASS